MNLVDSSGWIEYFMNGPLAERYAGYLNKSSEVLTPTVVLFEVYKKIKKELNEEQALLAAAQIEKTEIAAFSPTIAYRAADLALHYKLHMADAIVYATSDIYKVPTITSDADFKGLPNVIFIK
jgi:predicted nucleic acid-binding protein